MKQILIGFMGSGKSTVAKRLGRLMQLPVVEMDELALQKANTKSMHELFAKGAEPLLREMEAQVAKEYALVDNIIISTGGGTILNKEALQYFTQRRMIFLHASFKTIATRLVHDDSRPLFKNLAEAERLYNFRLPLYRSVADLVIDVENKSVEQIAEEIHGK